MQFSLQHFDTPDNLNQSRPDQAFAFLFRASFECTRHTVFTLLRTVHSVAEGATAKGTVSNRGAHYTSGNGRDRKGHTGTFSSRGSDVKGRTV